MLARALFMVLALTACGGGQHNPPPAAQTAPASPPAETAGAEAEPAVAIPDSPAGRQLAWVLEILGEHDGAVDEAALRAHFDPSFLAQVPADTMVPLMAQLASMGPFAIEAIDASEDGTRLVARAATKTGPMQIHLGVVADGAIETLLFRPAPAPGPELGSWAEVKDATTALAPEVGYVVAELDRSSGALTSIAAHQPDTQLAIGSTFKLYVLAALADRIAAGKLSWDEPLAVRDEWKSLPSGNLQNREAGTEVPVREVAGQMIAISDNTATDLLIHTLGRARVEAAMKRVEHSEPSRNIPFYTTRELFVLKMALTDAERAAFLALPASKRRRRLEGPIARRPLPELALAADWVEPRAIDQLEWFASATDLARVLAALAQRATEPTGAPLLDILSKNPGLKLDPKRWTFVGHKGGSEPGVLNLSWLLRRADDRWFVASFTFNSTTAALDEAKIFGVLTSALDVLGSHE